MSITKNKDKWVLDFRTGGRDSKRISKTFSRKIDAQIWLDKFKEDKKVFIDGNITESNPNDVTFKREAEFWITNSKFKFSASHAKRVAGVLEIILPKYGELNLSKINPTLLVAFQQEMMNQDYARGTVNRYTEVFTAIVNHSIRHRRFPYDPTSGFQKLSLSNIEMNFWEKEEAESFLLYADSLYPKGSESRWIYTVYLLALNTALRAGEIWGLKVGDLAEGGKLLTIRRQFNAVEKDFSPLKGKKNSKSAKNFRIVPCNENLYRELRSIADLKRLNADKLFFTNKEGNAICHDNFSTRVFAKDLAKWEGKKIRFHDMRHTAITLFISSGVDLKTVQEIAGHENIQTTMNYTHLVASNIEKVANLVGVTPRNQGDKVFKMHVVNGDSL